MELRILEALGLHVHCLMGSHTHPSFSFPWFFLSKKLVRDKYIPKIDSKNILFSVIYIRELISHLSERGFYGEGGATCTIYDTDLLQLCCKYLLKKKCIRKRHNSNISYIYHKFFIIISVSWFDVGLGESERRHIENLEYASSEIPTLLWRRDF